MRSRLSIARALGAALLGLGLAVLAVIACNAAPRIGSHRAPLLASGCCGAAATLALLLASPGERRGRSESVTTLALVTGLCSSIVLILVCAVATPQYGE